MIKRFITSNDKTIIQDRLDPLNRGTNDLELVCEFLNDMEEQMLKKDAVIEYLTQQNQELISKLKEYTEQ